MTTNPTTPAPAKKLTPDFIKRLNAMAAAKPRSLSQDVSDALVAELLSALKTREALLCEVLTSTDPDVLENYTGLGTIVESSSPGAAFMNREQRFTNFSLLAAYVLERFSKGQLLDHEATCWLPAVRRRQGAGVPDIERLKTVLTQDRIKEIEKGYAQQRLSTRFKRGTQRNYITAGLEPDAPNVVIKWQDDCDLGTLPVCFNERLSRRRMFLVTGQTGCAVYWMHSE